MNIKLTFVFFTLLFSYQVLPAQSILKSIAKVIVNKNHISVEYHESKIVDGEIENNNQWHVNQKKESISGKIFQTIVITSNNGEPLLFKGIIRGSNESFACESEPHDGLKIVRHVVGPSYNLLNQAIYERESDWLFSIDRQTAKVNIVLSEASDKLNLFRVNATGSEITLRFKPFYYKTHRDLSYFNPKEYSVWKRSVVGWTSWFAYLDEVDEMKIKRISDVLSDKLKPFGLQYIQIDDGYEQQPIGLPYTWLHPNNKFPNGMGFLANYIKSKGLIPAIWTNVSFMDSLAALKNKDLFVKDEKNLPAYGRWIGYSLNGSDPKAISTIITPVYKGFKEMGWKYFKLDALRHLRYEGYNSNDYFFNHFKINKIDAFRNVVKNVRNDIGKENFLLACWGPRPELIGLIDGCRIGSDGYSYAGLAQFNSFNNVIWKNDPDHIELTTKEAFRSCTATSLTGSLFMLTDKPETYNNLFLLEAAKRSIPVLETLPGQVYDVDPSRSMNIKNALIEMSGSGPRNFDASVTTTTGLFSLEISKKFENWIVLGRLDDRDKKISFRDLGLDKSSYLIFEFWSKKFYGIYDDNFIPGQIDSNYNCQVFSIRKKLDGPQILATSRHISCGGLDLIDVVWKNNQLSGESDIVLNDPYSIYIYEPSNYTLKNFTLENAKILSNSKKGYVREIKFDKINGGTVKWQIDY